ncbi:MAG: glycosyltransferase family 1 protein [Acidobacteria bacterium]|nr:MAG: glycosyltransferase family 1 protein [Acidobacteriota bacterium]REJ99066.1 MAG: glycosyltransferase family 1 protein [Acidobacteriota bacterium]REK16214.1 MAG: glycosyltransferase family 1 protein [Acidobacteriota bacterium]REK43895.1 MAG: glycosyltransferase family 1 protein [Acidobacteriota bacterium]
MKILRIIARLNVGGPARHVVWLTEALNDGEFESLLLAGTVPPTEEDMGYFADQHGVKPVFIEEMSRELSPKDAVSLWKVWRRVLAEKPDIIHTHTAKAGTIGRVAGFLYKWITPSVLIGRPRRVKLIHTYHGHIFHSYYGKAKTRLFLFIERTLARLATDKILTITEQQRKEIHEDYGVGAGGQFEVVPLGIDLSVFEDPGSRRKLLRDEIGAADGDIVVGIVGRLTEIKDHELFLRAARELSHEGHEVHGSNEPGSRARDRQIKFVVIGDGHLRVELEELAEKLGLDERVDFIGNREDPDVFYAGLDIVALTSRNEGTPLSLIEAMANRIPVVSTAVGGVVDLVGDRRQETGDIIGTRSASDGQDRSQKSEVGSQKSEIVSQGEERAQSSIAVCERGVSVHSREPEDFAAAISLLVNDIGLRERIADAGFQFVKAKYDKSRLVSDIKKLYRELIVED